MTIGDFPDGPFTAADARRRGISRARLRCAVRDGEVRTLLRGVYVHVGLELTVELRCRAASLVVSPTSVVCDRTAAWVLGVDCLAYGELDGTPRLETCVLPGNRATNRPECAGRTRDLLPRDWIELAGVRVTTPVRTALDLGCLLSRRDAMAAMDALMRAHRFSAEDLRRELPRYFRRRGAIQLRQLVPLVDPRSESASESWMRLEIHDRGLPAPLPQYWVDVDGVPTYRLDLAYPRAKVAIEYDGEEFHSSEEQRERDRARRRWLREHGWTVIVLTKDSFTEEAIIVWLAQIRAALATR